MTTLSEVIADAVARLVQVGIDTPSVDVGWLAERAFSIAPGAQRRHGTLLPDPKAIAVFQDMIDRRAAREPLQRILGDWEFWGLTLHLNAETLIPRADTECLIEGVLRQRPDRSAPWRILDLGTGSGAILLALLSVFPNATGIGIDLSHGAALMARDNAESLGLHARAAFLVGDWAAALQARFDIVVANPPYIPNADIDGLAPEVALHEPRRALAGGQDGLDACRKVVLALPDLLVPNGLAAMEHGFDQGPALRQLFLNNKLTDVMTRTDLAGHERVTIGVFSG